MQTWGERVWSLKKKQGPQIIEPPPVVMTNNGVRKQIKKKRERERRRRRRKKITTKKNEQEVAYFGNKKIIGRKFTCFYIYLRYKLTHGKWGQPISYTLHWKIVWGLYLIVFQLSYLFKFVNTIILVLSNVNLRIQRCLRILSYILEIFFQLYFCSTVIWGQCIIPLCIVLAEGWGRILQRILFLNLPW